MGGILRIFVGAIVLSVSLPVSLGADRRLVWLEADGSTRWSASLSSGESTGDLSPGRLTVGPWFPRLPSLRLSFDKAEPRALESFAGKVLVLDFWATWCEPCAIELPLLQALRDEEAARGLEVVAVNMQEQPAAVRQFFWVLNLSLPIAYYDEAADEAFGVQSLPTVIVADRRGCVRARWDGYRPGLEKEVGELVRSLLDEGPDGPEPEPIADVLAGEGLLRAVWSREGSRTIDGLALVATGTGGRDILAVAGRDVTLHAADGGIRRRWSHTRSVGELRSDGTRTVVGVRRGGTRIVPIDPEHGAAESWDAPAPVLDAEVLPGGELVLATTEGLHRIAADGTSRGGRADLTEVINVASAVSDDAFRLAVLDGGGHLAWLDAALKTVGDGAGPTGRCLVRGAPGSGIGLASAPLGPSAVGRLAGGTGAQIALAAGDELLLLDLDSGRERFRARWPGIAGLASGDLEGDGRDELVVASGRRLTVLRGAEMAQSSR